MNSYDISKELYKYYINFNYKLNNAYVFNWESDFFAVSNSNYVYEVEIKISKSDFKNDFNKTIYGNQKKHDYLFNGKLRPNKFLFACPEGLININEIPKEYGLIYITKEPYSYAKIIQNGKYLHKENLFDNKIFLRSLLDKFYYRNIDLKRQMKLFDWDLKYSQERIFMF